VPRVDDHKVIISIIFVLRNGCAGVMHRASTARNRFVRWSRLGVFNRIFAGLAGKAGQPDRLMIDATYLKAHRTAASLLKRGFSPPYRAHERRLELEAARGRRW
jgi:putative transposase